MSGERKDIETDKRKYLVVGCGTGTLCTNHPHERWVSVDINPEVKPDVNKDLEELKPADFKDKKFQIVYVEGITNGINSQRAKILEPLMDNNYALISDQAYSRNEYE